MDIRFHLNFTKVLRSLRSHDCKLVANSSPAHALAVWGWTGGKHIEHYSQKNKNAFCIYQWDDCVENKVLIEFNIPFLHLLLNKHSYPQQMLASSTRYAIQISSIKIYYIHPTKPIQYRNKYFQHQQENSLMFSIPPIRSLLFLELKVSFRWEAGAIWAAAD